MSKVRRRRNHSITALGLIAAALLIGLSSLQDLVVLQAPAARIQALGVLEVDLQPDGAVEPDEEIQPIVLVCAAGLFLSGLLLLITRVRYLGIMWRLVALGSLLLPIVLAVTYWMFVDDPKRALVSQDDPALQEMIRTGALVLNDALGGGFEPRAGLYVLTAGCMLALISVFIPAIRRDVVLPGHVQRRRAYAIGMSAYLHSPHNPPDQGKPTSSPVALTRPPFGAHLGVPPAW
jgi:hypothetical protein